MSAGKRRRFWKAVIPHPVELADSAPIDANSTPSQELELAPGDVLFIPSCEPTLPPYPLDAPCI
jgi:hypothetical protein